MTDLDGKNILANAGFETDLAYFWQFGRDTNIGNIFFWNDHLRINAISEDEAQMVCRSACRVSKIRLEIFTLATVNPSYFALRKNGNNLIADETDDVFRIDVGAGQTGIFDFPDDIFNFDALDFICMKWREIDAGNPAIDFQMSCLLQFERA